MFQTTPAMFQTTPVGCALERTAHKPTHLERTPTPPNPNKKITQNAFEPRETNDVNVVFGNKKIMGNAFEPRAM